MLTLLHCLLLHLPPPLLLQADPGAGAGVVEAALAAAAGGGRMQGSEAHQLAEAALGAAQERMKQMVAAARWAAGLSMAWDALRA